MNRRVPAAVVAAIVSIGSAGCRPNRAIRSGTVVDGGVKPMESPVKPVSVDVDAATGTVVGIVRYRGRVPERLKIDMGRDIVCLVTGGANVAEQVVVRNGGLANVYIYLKDGPEEAMHAPAPAQHPVLLEQVGCRYVPHVLAVMKGSTVEFRNSDGTRHSANIMTVGHAGEEVRLEAKGAPVARVFDATGVMMPVRCDSHPWMKAFLNVSATPFFAVTDGDGRFDITGLPPGAYTLAAVQEELGEQTLRLTVASNSQTPAEFTFSARQGGRQE